MIWEFQLHPYPVDLALRWSTNDVLLHTSSAALGWKPDWHSWLDILPSTNAFDAHVLPPGCLLPQPSVCMAQCLWARWCAGFTRAEMPRIGGLKCTASTLIHWHLVLMPFDHHLKEGKSSHTRRDTKSIQISLWLQTQVINTCLKVKQEHQELNDYEITCSSKAGKHFSCKHAYGLLCRKCYKPWSEPSHLELKMPQCC